MGSRIGEAEKKIASWEPLRARRSERNGRGLEWLSLGDTGQRVHPPWYPPPKTPEPCTHQPLVVMDAVEPLEDDPPFRRTSLHRLWYGRPGRFNTNEIIDTCASPDRRLHELARLKTHSGFPLHLSSLFEISPCSFTRPSFQYYLVRWDGKSRDQAECNRQSQQDQSRSLRLLRQNARPR